MALKLVKKDSAEIDHISSEEKILKGLNEPQNTAVLHKDGPILVIAGAGSGKTRVLTHRVAYLIEQGVKPYQILSLTFTNKAAGEMKERISSLVSPEAAERIWAGTFHSVFARILRREAEHLGFTKSFSIYDSDDSLSAIKAIMNLQKIDMKQYPPQPIRSRISWAKNQMMSWQEVSQNADSPNDEMAAEIFKAYQDYLKQNNAMDFDDLLLNLIILFKNFPDVLNHYQNWFKYLLVDEYQDTNRAQYLALNLLAQKNKNICVVGDDAQSIYRWRGAEIRNILEFENDFPNAQTVRLEQNYRSTQTILNAAGSVIKHNTKQIPKTLWTENPEGDKIKIVSNYDDKEESQKIAELIREQIREKDYKASDFAILYRTNAQSLNIENALRFKKLPYVVLGGMSFYKRKEIKDSIAYLRLLLNPRDNESLMRIVNEPPRGLGKVSIRHIQNYAIGHNIPLFEAFSFANEIGELKPKAKKSAMEFHDLVRSFQLKKESTPPQEMAIKFIEKTGMLDMYEEIGTDDSQDRWNNIQQLLSDISTFFRDYDSIDPFSQEEEAKLEEPGLEEYMQQVSLVSEIDKTDTSNNQVKLMTLHTAKGLEFPVVFIAGMEQGLFPLSKAEFHPEEEEEERRLFYVGMTRAEEKLFITYANRRSRFGEYQNQIPSKFIDEIDKEFLDTAMEEKTRSKTSGNGQGNMFFEKYSTYQNKVKKEKEQKKIKTKKPPAQVSHLSFQTGDFVEHSMFGEGKIEAIMGLGEQKQATVNFNSHGRKKLMIMYAKLKKL